MSKNLKAKPNMGIALFAWFGMALYTLLVASEQEYVIDLGFIPSIRVNLIMSITLRLMAVYMFITGAFTLKKILQEPD